MSSALLYTVPPPDSSSLNASSVSSLKLGSSGNGPDGPNQLVGERLRLASRGAHRGDLLQRHVVDQGFDLSVELGGLGGGRHDLIPRRAGRRGGEGSRRDRAATATQASRISRNIRPAEFGVFPSGSRFLWHDYPGGWCARSLSDGAFPREARRRFGANEPKFKGGGSGRRSVWKIVRTNPISQNSMDSQSVAGQRVMRQPRSRTAHRTSPIGGGKTGSFDVGSAVLGVDWRGWKK